MKEDFGEGGMRSDKWYNDHSKDEGIPNIPDSFRAEDSNRDFEELREQKRNEVINVTADNIEKVISMIEKGDSVLEFNITDESVKALRNKYLALGVALSKMDETDPHYAESQSQASILKKILGADPQKN